MELQENSHKECPGCALPVEKGAKVCPYCGYEFPQHKGSTKWVAILIIIILLIPLIRLLWRLLSK